MMLLHHDFTIFRFIPDGKRRTKGWTEATDGLFRDGNYVGEGSINITVRH